MNNKIMTVKENLTNHGLNRILSMVYSTISNHVSIKGLTLDTISQEIEKYIRDTFNIADLPEGVEMRKDAMIEWNIESLEKLLQDWRDI